MRELIAPQLPRSLECDNAPVEAAPVADQDVPAGMPRGRRLGCVPLLLLAGLPVIPAIYVAGQASPTDMYGLVGAEYGFFVACAWWLFSICLGVAIRGRDRASGGGHVARWIVVGGVGVAAAVFTAALLRSPTPTDGLAGESAAGGRDLLADALVGAFGADRISIGQVTMTPCLDALGRPYGATRVNLDAVRLKGKLLTTEDFPAVEAALERAGWSVSVSPHRFHDVEGKLLDARKGDYVISVGPAWPAGSEYADEQPSVLGWSSCLRA